MRQQSFAASTAFAFSLVAASALAIAATPAQARQGAQADVQAKADSTADADKKICKRIEHSGSRMARHRVCLTAADWKKVDETR